MRVKDVRRIKVLMKGLDISARQLAAGAGYASHSYVNRILAGDVRTVTPYRARRIARILEADVDALFVASTSTDTRRSDTRRVS